MSKKTNEMKRVAKQKGNNPRRSKGRGRTKNPLGIMSEKAIADTVATLMFGTVGTALLLALKINPIDLLSAASKRLQEKEAEQGETIQ